jgi:hypothetical protein
MVAAGFAHIVPGDPDVHEAVGTIRKVMLQLAIEPRSPPVSSTTNNFQLPLGLSVPRKEDKVGFGWATDPGPGAGKLSGSTPNVPTELVGFQVPFAIGTGIGFAAASLRTRFLPNTPFGPPSPISDIRITFLPAGDCNTISTSPGQVCVNPSIATDCTYTPAAGKEATGICEGYGVLIPADGIEIGILGATAVKV